MTIRTTVVATAPAAAELWSLRKDERWIDCELHAENGGFVVYVLRQGQVCARAAFSARAKAMDHAEELRRDLCSTGWQ